MRAGTCGVIVRWAACVLACLLVQPTHAADPAPATMLEAPPPAYPAEATRSNDEGTVHLRVHVLASGLPGEVRVGKSSGVPALDAAAVGAATRARFRAARNAAGEPVDSWVSVPYQFILQD